MSNTCGLKPVAASRLELDNLASFMKGAVAYKNKIGFKGELLLEPKPQVDIRMASCV